MMILQLKIKFVILKILEWKYENTIKKRSNIAEAKKTNERK